MSDQKCASCGKNISEPIKKNNKIFCSNDCASKYKEKDNVCEFC